MDPNANLAEQRRICARMEAGDYTADDHYRDGERLRDLVVALDEWITKGGFLPAAWRK